MKVIEGVCEFVEVGKAVSSGNNYGFRADIPGVKFNSDSINPCVVLFAAKYNVRYVTGNNHAVRCLLANYRIANSKQHKREK